jgi:putative tricarboxylic transport membrane protein
LSAAPEAANNAGVQTSFIPMLTLGTPTSAVMALMVGAMVIMGIQPGPQVMTSNPGLFWGLITSMWVGNPMLVILNLPLIRIWVKMLTVPYRFLFPAIMAFCAIGCYTLGNNNFEVYCASFFDVVGFALHKLGLEPAPLILGFILGPLMEENLRRALLMSNGDWSVFVTSPISAGMLLVSAAMVVAIALPAVSRKRKEAFKDDE